jgi:hypothetical protein
MTNDELISGLREIAQACSHAVRKTTRRGVRNQLRWQADVMLGAADAIVQLQQRLVRQACYFEHIEAVNEPRWPLLEDDDTDAGAAL